MRTSYNTNPLHRLRRILKQAPGFDDVTRQHVLNYLQGILKDLANTHDLRRLTVAADLVGAYANHARLQARLFETEAGSPQAQELTKELSKESKRYIQAARMLGVTRTGGTRSRGRPTANVFEPPRGKAPSERARDGEE